MSKKSLLRYDHANMPIVSASVVGRLDTVRDVLSENPPSFFAMPAGQDISAIVERAAVIARKFRTLIVVGIGGSDLGARTLVWPRCGARALHA